MAVALRLSRCGRPHRPFYHIIATDSRSSRDGKYIERLGHYDPNHNPSKVVVNAERLQYWYGLGAEVSNTVAKIAKFQNIKLERAKTTKNKK